MANWVSFLMEVVSSHLDLYWRSYEQFTRGISTITRVGWRGFDNPGAWTKSLTRGCTAGSVPRVSLPGRPYQKLDDGLTQVGRPWHLPRARLYLGWKSTFLKGVLDFSMETITFSKDHINTLVIPKLWLISFSLKTLSKIVKTWIFL